MTTVSGQRSAVSSQRSAVSGQRSAVRRLPSAVNGVPMYKFEKLEVWQMAVEYTDHCYAITEQLPANERYNLVSQMQRASTSIALNIAEGSTGQTDKEQASFLSMAIRSLVETVACQHLIHRRGYLADTKNLREAYVQSNKFMKKLLAFRQYLLEQAGVREEQVEYVVNGEREIATPFE
jgi:four helix bundle protein